MLDTSGQPLEGYVMLAYSTDPRYWLSNARRVKLARSANDGTYEFVGLPAGEYYVAAAADINQARRSTTPRCSKPSPASR